MNNKRLLVISFGELLNAGSAGTAVIRGFIAAALENGFKVSYVGLIDERGTTSSSPRYDFGELSKNLRQETIKFSRRKKTVFRSIQQSYDNTAMLTPIGDSFLMKEPYDGVLSFETLAYSLAKSVTARCHISIIADPAGERMSNLASTTKSLKHTLLSRLVSYLEVNFWRQQKLHVSHLAMFGSRHAREWTDYLGIPIIDLRPMLPTVDFAPDEIHRYDENKLIFAYGGTLATTATQMGSNILATTLRDAFAQALGTSYEMRIIGFGSAHWVDQIASWPQINVVGEVDSFERALSQVDVFVLPMKYPVGVRTRICSALQAGCYCIADPALLQNMPELKDQPFIAFAEDPESYAAILRAYRKLPDKPALRKAARQFFAQHYLYDVASEPLLMEFRQ